MKLLAIFLISMLFLVGCGEQEGTVEWSDCREKIYLKEEDLSTLIGSYTCQYQKTDKGRIMSGLCVRISYDGHTCKTAYIYYKKQEKICTDPKYPYLGKDDMCYP
jgi:hypothetical protein